MKERIFAVVAATFVAIMCLVFNQISWADGDSDKMAILKTIEGTWKTEPAPCGRSFVVSSREMEFGISGRSLVITERLTGLPAQSGKVSFDDIKSLDGEKLKCFYAEFQGQNIVRSGLTLIISQGKIEGETTTTGSTGRYVPIAFSKK